MQENRKRVCQGIEDADSGDMCTLIAGNALQIDTYSRCALFSPVWLCCFIYDSMVWFGQYVFAGMV